jgi:hypothetical protein
MRNLKLTITMIVVFFMQTALSQQKNDSTDIYYFNKTRDSLMNSKTKQAPEENKKKNVEDDNKRGLGSSFFGLNLEIIFGAGISNTEFDIAGDTTGLSNAESKTGPVLGVNIGFNLMGLALATGFNYSSKGFQSGSSTPYSANYLNIPLLFAFNFNISKVEIGLAGGPYIGILLSQDKSEYYALKNIDLGITGTVQGTYFFNRFMGALLGVKYEHGGLNGLLEENGMSGYVSSVKTRNWFIFSGIKFVL